jgi:hypothetical protein
MGLFGQLETIANPQRLKAVRKLEAGLAFSAQ